MKSFKRVCAMLLAAVMVLGLAACGGGETQSAVSNDDLVGQNADVTNTENITKSGYVADTVTVAFTSATSLSPWGTSNNTPGNYEVYECLYEEDINGTVIPILADKSRGGNNPDGVPGYDHEAGSLEYTVYIYDYIYDHAGNHVTADDVVFSYNYQHDNAVTSGWDVLQKVEALDDTTVRFTFTHELDGVGEWEQLFIYCFIVDEDSWNASPSHLLNEMIGTGPYAQLAYTSGASLTLVAYPGYWQKEELRPQVSQQNAGKIVYKFINEVATRVMAFKNDEIDISDDIDTINTYDFLETGEYGGKFNVWTYPAGLIYSMWLNCSEKSLCGDVNMRKAVYYAMDTDMLIALTGGTNLPVNSYSNNSNVDYDPSFDEIESYNSFHGPQEERKALVDQYLKAAGYNGEPLMFLYQSDMQDVVTAIINILGMYGITCDSRGTDHAGAASILEDPTQWDIEYGQWGGSYLVQKWAHAYDWANTTAGDHTVNYIYDQEWQDLLMLVQSKEGHTTENMLKWLQMMYDNAYGMNLFNSTKSIVYRDNLHFLYRNNKFIIIPGACEYHEVSGS